ncbi:MAG: 3-phosphoserine/phosphohydroxythreonine transaminase [Gammaproteobacteria bacterium]|nr:3-phosphoserine/phosphohydroxythreonine transaminase [Gammaproteobacteria bacterium]
MKPRGYYFGAGPAVLPDEILTKAQQDLWTWKDTGVSILEIGHRTEVFMNLMQETETLIRKLLKITDDYAVLFLGGAARAQFAMVPMNILQPGKRAAHVVTGTWSQMAFDEAKRLYPESTYCVASSESSAFRLPVDTVESIQTDTQYLSFTPNETIHGNRYEPTAAYNHLPWVADMTSCILSEPINIQQYGLIFAGAQKNLANAGMTLVIVKKAWLEQSPMAILPTMFDYRVHEKHQSLYSTPPTFNCYLAYEMLKWVEAQGGVEEMKVLNQRKSDMLYDFLDSSSQFQAFVAPSIRSKMNVCFSTGNAEKDAALLKKADAKGLYGLKGHRVLGGLRASLYNAMPLQGVESLIDFLSSS